MEAADIELSGLITGAKITHRRIDDAFETLTFDCESSPLPEDIGNLATILGNSISNSSGRKQQVMDLNLVAPGKRTPEDPFLYALQGPEARTTYTVTILPKNPSRITITRANECPAEYNYGILAAFAAEIMLPTK